LKEKGGDWKTANALPLKSGKAIELAVPGQLVWPGHSTAPSLCTCEAQNYQQAANLVSYWKHAIWSAEYAADEGIL